MAVHSDEWQNPNLLVHEVPNGRCCDNAYFNRLFNNMCCTSFMTGGDKSAIHRSFLDKFVKSVTQRSREMGCTQISLSRHPACWADKFCDAICILSVLNSRISQTTVPQKIGHDMMIFHMNLAYHTHRGVFQLFPLKTLFSVLLFLHFDWNNVRLTGCIWDIAHLNVSKIRSDIKWSLLKLCP